MSGHDIGYKAGIIVGTVVGILLFCVLIRFMRNNGSMKADYDERQELIRGRGYKLGFFTLLILEVVSILLKEFYGELPVEASMEQFILICLSIMVFVSYAIWNEGYFAINENPKKVMIAFIGVLLMNLFPTINAFSSGIAIEDEKLTFHAANLVCVILFFVVFVVLLAKTIVDKREEE